MGDSTFTDESTNGMKKKDDTFLAIFILVAAVVAVLVVGIYIRNRNFFNSGDSSWKQTSFLPPPERDVYIEAKKRLDPSKISELDELKKLLMKRAINTIPILLKLQNEGSSIERLYKRGMLTDDMHFQVKELKAFVDQEFQDVQFEADELVEGWSQSVWPQAMQFHQMIQKQAESKAEEPKVNDEEKKKTESPKKKEAVKKDATVQNAVSSVVSKPVSTPVIVAIDPEQAKLIEAEKMAQLLLEEEEAEKKKAPKKKK